MSISAVLCMTTGIFDRIVRRYIPHYCDAFFDEKGSQGMSFGQRCKSWAPGRERSKPLLGRFHDSPVWDEEDYVSRNIDIDSRVNAFDPRLRHGHFATTNWWFMLDETITYNTRSGKESKQLLVDVIARQINARALYTRLTRRHRLRVRLKHLLRKTQACLQ